MNNNGVRAARAGGKRLNLRIEVRGPMEVRGARTMVGVRAGVRSWKGWRLLGASGGSRRMGGGGGSVFVVLCCVVFGCGEREGEW